MLSIRITPQAESYLVETWLYTSENWSVEQVDEYPDQLEAGLNHLTVHPSLGVDYSHILPHYRKLRIEH